MVEKMSDKLDDDYLTMMIDEVLPQVTNVFFEIGEGTGVGIHFPPAAREAVRRLKAAAADILAEQIPAPPPDQQTTKRNWYCKTCDTWFTAADLPTVTIGGGAPTPINKFTPPRLTRALCPKGHGVVAKAAEDGK